MKKYLIIVVIVLVSLVGGLYLFSKIKNVDKIINNENEYLFKNRIYDTYANAERSQYH